MNQMLRHPPRPLLPLASPASRVLLAVVTALLALALAATSTAATDVNVSIVFRAYQASTVTINAGETVTWTNQALVPHTVTAVAGEFNSGKLNSQQSFSVTFAKPGDYLYACTIHPSMKGNVIVREAPTFPPPGVGPPVGPAPPAGAVPPMAPPPRSIYVHLSRSARRTLVRVHASFPGATALLEGYYRSSWRRVAQARLSSTGQATLSASSSGQRLRVVVLAPAGEPPLISKVLRAYA